MFTRLLNSQAAQHAVSAVIGTYLDLTLRCTRWQVAGAEHLEPFHQNVPVVFAFWHECLPLMPAVWTHLRQRNPARRGAVLISRHRDGRFIASTASRFGFEVVHGSTTTKSRDKGGAAALRSLLARLSGGDAVVVTPDGPRGPPRKAAGGVALLAAISGAPVLPAAARMRHRIVLPTWDRMVLPLPFGRGVIVCLPPFTVAPGARDQGQTRLDMDLNEAASRAEAMCRA